MPSFTDDRLHPLNNESSCLIDDGMRQALLDTLEPDEMARAAYSVGARIWLEAVLTDRALLLVKGAVKARAIRLPFPLDVVRPPRGTRAGARINTPLGTKTLWGSKLDSDMRLLLRAAGQLPGDDEEPAAAPVPPESPAPVDAEAASPGRRRGVRTALWVAATLVIAGLIVFGNASPSSANEGVVKRVVDGDTLVVEIDGEERTVRLLNVDTPETKHPDEPVECLGPEATELTSALAAPGTRVTLRYDEERKDGYGRDLATVLLPDGRSLSEELARAGLGVPISIGPDTDAYAGVSDARDDAIEARRGFFDPAEECTVPAEVRAAQEALTEAASGAAPATVAATGSDIAELTAAVAAAVAVNEALRAPGRALRWTAYTSAALTQLELGLSRDVKQGRTRLNELREHRTELRKEARRKRIEARRAREAAEVAERERQRLAELAAKPAPAPVPTPAPAPAPDYSSNDDGGSSSSGSGGDPYPGYNGPRCYEPGGKVWHPC